MRKHSSIFVGMMNNENFNTEKRSESVAQTVEATLNDLKNSVEPSKLEMKNVLFAGVNSDEIEKMIEKYSVKPPLNLIDENEFDLYTKGHFNQALCAAVMSYHSDCKISAPLWWCYRFIPLAYKLAAQALHAKDLMLISRNLKREARFYEVQSYSSKKKEFSPRSKTDPYRESITMGMVIYMLKATQRAKNDFLFSHALKCLEQEYSKRSLVPSFLPYISHAFFDLANFVQQVNITSPTEGDNNKEIRSKVEEAPIKAPNKPFIFHSLEEEIKQAKIVNMFLDTLNLPNRRITKQSDNKMLAIVMYFDYWWYYLNVYRKTPTIVALRDFFLTYCRFSPHNGKKELSIETVKTAISEQRNIKDKRLEKRKPKNYNTFPDLWDEVKEIIRQNK